jgi:hypothetical protein
VADLAEPEVVNGPQDLVDWDAIDWRYQEEQVQRLRQRIFKATQAADLKQVRNLQKLMLRSRANTLVSVRQVSERNTGRHTAGIDGRVALISQDRADLAVHLHHQARAHQVLPVRRVYIVRRAALRRIPCSVGRNSEGGFCCATKRLVVFPAQLGGIRRDIPGSNGLPESERTLGENSMPLKRWPCPGTGTGCCEIRAIR